MALTTQGSSLSTLSRAPRIPESVGQLDVKAIYDGVRQGLAAFENVRRAPASMALADADTRAKTLEAPMGTVLAEEAAKQAPLRTQILAIDANTAQQMKDAQIAGLTAKAAPKPLTGKAYHFDRIDKLRAADPEGNDPAIQQALKESLGELAQNIAAEKNATTLAAGAARNATSAANAGANISAREALSAEDRALKDTLTRLGYQSAEKIAQDRIAAQKADNAARRDQQLALVDTKHQAALSKQLGALEGLTQSTKNIEQTIDEAIALAGPTTTGLAANSAFLPFDARTLRGKLDTIRASTGFNALANMRDASPMGGALGAVSDTENKLLQSTIASLDQGMRDTDLKAALLRVKEQRAKSLALMHDTYDRDVEILKPRANPAPAQAGSAAQATPSAPPTVTTKAQYDALPPNAPYTDAQGVLRRKVGNG